MTTFHFYLATSACAAAMSHIAYHVVSVHDEEYCRFKVADDEFAAGRQIDKET